INGSLAQALSTASGSSGQAEATAKTNFGILNSIQATATSQVGGSASANAFAQAGGSGSGAFNPGQSFSLISGDPVGSMGAAGAGASLNYNETADFSLNSLGG